MTPSERIRQLLAQARTVREGGWRDIVVLLNALRRAVVLSVIEHTPLDAATAEAVIHEVNALMARFNYDLKQEMSQNQRRLFLKGIQTVDGVLKGHDIKVVLPYLPETMLQKLQTFSADLVTRITDDARARIASEIRLGTLGEKPSTEVVKEIGQNLTDPSVFASIAVRARVIYETETRRIQNLAAAERMKQVVEQAPDLQKMWLHSHRGIPRPNHFDMDKKMVGAGDSFKLMGRNGVEYEITGPHDPKLPAGEVVNCGCVLISVIPRFVKAKPKAA